MADQSYKFSEIKVRKESPKAYFVEMAGGAFWVPKSQILAIDDFAGTLATTRWWAEVSGALEAAEHADERLTDQEIPSASAIYRNLAFKYHPDRNPDSDEFMRDLNWLWQAVKAELKRK